MLCRGSAGRRAARRQTGSRRQPAAGCRGHRQRGHEKADGHTAAIAEEDLRWSGEVPAQEREAGAGKAEGHPRQRCLDRDRGQRPDARSRDGATVPQAPSRLSMRLNAFTSPTIQMTSTRPRRGRGPSSIQGRPAISATASAASASTPPLRRHGNPVVDACRAATARLPRSSTGASVRGSHCRSRDEKADAVPPRRRRKAWAPCKR